MTRRVFATVGVDPEIEFLATDFGSPPSPAPGPVTRTVKADDAAAAVRALLVACGFEAPFADLEGDARRVAERLGDVKRIEVLRPVFYRGRGAYVVGRTGDGRPLVLALRHPDEAGITVDAVLDDEDSVSILFSFTRSYFRVDADRTWEVVRFLKELLPKKRVAELYISAGYDKHGKTELYRDLLAHLRDAPPSHTFEEVPGTPGLVMIVFGIPEYDLVFKVIRDRFPRVKEFSRGHVKARYELVFQHDRAGRLVDAQQFEHLRLDRGRFSDALIEELSAEAADSLTLTDDAVVVHHCSVERRVTPLDVCARAATESGDARATAEAAILDWGRCIKDLADTGIFPGDLLLKNFGVTRHGRVVFYAYDELCLLSDVRFRAFPPARSYEDEMSAEPWFSVSEGDVFPEEFSRFLGLPADLRAVFESAHADLFEASTWQAAQRRISGGDLPEVFPYTAGYRLERQE